MDDAVCEDSAMVESKTAESVHLPHDSMVTVRLSETPLLTVVTQSMAMSEQEEYDSAMDFPMDMPDPNIGSREDLQTPLPNGNSIPIAVEDESTQLLQDPSNDQLTIDADERRGSESTEDSGDGEVNWAELERTEEQEPRDQDSEDVRNRFPGC
jgi:hypothetical protein